MSFSSSGVFGRRSAITVLLESRPIVLGHFRADSHGTVSGTVTIPRNAPHGWHVFRLTSNHPDQSVGTTIYVQGRVTGPSPSPTPPHHPGGHDRGGVDDGRNPGHPGGHGHGPGDEGRGPGHPAPGPHQAGLANTGSSEKSLALGGAAAALLVTGSGGMLAVRRRRSS
ncbi:LPXTG cell wall anchor domain-containing protein [Streptomyces tropicalis]|uniref:LPXTG cell wall anchor domain-containing protein n=1 Tax=Streptomyces tropicalis TaxID=3034234 RepID=A0ABT5ZZ16_9ACTN|nr:LPXTG cell wall anchor domain-containing protein [Streptomyces tropicalis]MDF3297630.1 LPXTG cell wall anchor domain-containing protein [Streptomyces tropicalis]